MRDQDLVEHELRQRFTIEHRTQAEQRRRLEVAFAYRSQGIRKTLGITDAVVPKARDRSGVDTHHRRRAEDVMRCAQDRAVTTDGDDQIGWSHPLYQIVFGTLYHIDLDTVIGQGVDDGIQSKAVLLVRLENAFYTRLAELDLTQLPLIALCLDKFEIGFFDHDAGASDWGLCHRTSTGSGLIENAEDVRPLADFSQISRSELSRYASVHTTDRYLDRRGGAWRAVGCL